ncbi:enolase 2-phosphoglycerate dehydratase [Pyrenochaeta sp. DS3sAY3a]|nr:enolase 2-phosphoglycerate dehydratase [Pyrenochaeta sp. DS3sAY3a]
MVTLRITRIDVFTVDLPYSGNVYHLSEGRTYTHFAAIIVRVTASSSTGAEIDGWGESTPFGTTYAPSHAGGVRAAIATIAPELIGLDPRRVDRVNDAMDGALKGHEDAKTALDVACWDVFGKSVGLPVCELLGGRTDNDLPMISSLGICSPEEMRKQVQKFRDEGYLGHSVKVGTNPVNDAAIITAALADKQEGEFFLVDANCGMTTETALRMLRLLPPGLDFVLESPCATWRETMSLRKRTDIPIIFDELATDEASLARMISDDAAEGIGLKISKAGGLTRARRQRDMCIAAGYTMSVQDTTGSDIAFAAIVHLAQTVPRKNLRCILNSRGMVTLKTADTNFEESDKGVKAGKVPGLGIKVRTDVLGEPVASYP